MSKIDLEQQLPITISADSGFSSSLKPLLLELEMWINFQALKADWYGDEACILAFDFTLVRSLEDKGLAVSEKSGSAGTGKEWVSGDGYAYCYDSTSLNTTAFIAVADLLTPIKGGVGIEQAIKQRLVGVVNSIGKHHGLVSLG
ncbi:MULTISPECIES: hypothetical protein [unclassified Shewanella]|uniref:hypothetical protein n=1 Tax=unclassified Shewanella TaxID=196818 RepID=UPI001BBE3F22|nr:MULTISPECIES: hypothetical protein [unclassified Shewanella]GIU05210.1 hypothetical protein TUM4444_01200 [Shewanella sp. MBTL60-112-B1]GIU24265.1 hypothetical protein TUM4445_01170 [Shewanella sp. MBTL60-112-B2]